MESKTADVYECGKLIGICGAAGSGKTTASHHLISRGWVNEKMAGALKLMAGTLLGQLGLDVNSCLEGDMKETCISELGGKSPRHVMQTLGTEWGRECMHHDFWVDITKVKIQNLLNEGINVVVDDIRFDNEAEMIKSLGGELIKIERGAISTMTHISENPLSCDVVFINDGSIDSLHNFIDVLVE